MAGFSANDRRIAKNTIINYVRLFITLVIGLLTSRIVLQQLGVSDYGLYNVVGGVLSMFTFISASLSATTTRFINLELGKEDGDVNRMFNICERLHIWCAVAILVLAETLGVWYVLDVLKVAPGKEADAMFVYQVSTVVACVGIINVPYQSLFVAYEKFFSMALIDIINTVVKLLLVLLLFIYPGNLLKYYAVAMSVTTFISFIVYHILCHRYWPETVHLSSPKDHVSSKEVLAYNNYNLLSAVSVMARDAGSNLLINFFFGTIVNGAYAVAKTLQRYVNFIIANIDSASAPQIIQSYSSGNVSRYTSLVPKIGRISMLAIEMVFFPLWVEMGFVLHLWLGNVPEGALSFSKLTVIIVFVAASSCGLTQLIDATGKIKWFKIEQSVLYILCIPLGYFLYKLHFPAETILVLYILADIVNRVLQFILLKVIINFDSLRYIREAYFRPFVVALLMILYTLGYYGLHIEGPWARVAGILVTVLVTGIVVLIVGFKKKERNKLISAFMRKLQRK